MKTILVPVDFSDCSHNAYMYALDMAAAMQFEVVLFHNVFPNQGLDNNAYSAFFIEDFLAIKEEKLKEYISDALQKDKYRSLKLRYQLEVGFTIPGIVKALEDNNVELIVMGTTGASGLKEMTLGSTTGSVIANTKVPLMAIPPTAKFDQLNTNFVFASDFTRDINVFSVECLQSLADYKKANVTVLHVLEPKEEQPNTAEIEAQMSSILGHLSHNFHFIEDRSTAKAINIFVQSVDASLLCMLAHQRDFFSKIFYTSTTKLVSHHLSVPLLVMHE
ncbi:MAG: universal stress protein [Chitinophagales bacterium]|nr:universal stress protein [Bacteroidota bacterium]MCB9043936.1 universal stress protein [Chitinophagales bacterium]